MVSADGRHPPLGPGRRVPIHTEPGPLWNPTLEGAWRSEGGATLVASASYVSASGLSGFPETASYRVADDGLWLTVGSDRESSRHVELVKLTTTELVLKLSDGPLSFHRVE